MAKEYSDHIQERLEFLKIIDIVKKIEVENKYIDKISKIEKVREEKNQKEKERLEYLKNKTDKVCEKVAAGKTKLLTESVKKNRDKNRKLRFLEDQQHSKEEEMQIKLRQEKERENIK